MSGPDGRAASEATATSDGISAASLTLLAVYLAVLAVPLARWSSGSGNWWPVAIHTAALGFVVWIRATRRPLARALRDWTPLAVGPLLYVELRWIIDGVGMSHLDGLVRGWEAILFSSAPSGNLALQWPSRAASELLHLCYLSYYALVYVPPIILSLRGDRRALVRTMLALVIV